MHTDTGFRSLSQVQCARAATVPQSSGQPHRLSDGSPGSWHEPPAWPWSPRGWGCFATCSKFPSAQWLRFSMVCLCFPIDGITLDRECFRLYFIYYSEWGAGVMTCKNNLLVCVVDNLTFYVPSIPPWEKMNRHLQKFTMQRGQRFPFFSVFYEFINKWGVVMSIYILRYIKNCLEFLWQHSGVPHFW